MSQLYFQTKQSLNKHIFFLVETLVIDEIVTDGTSGMTILPTNGILNIKL